uniref:DUF7869 domain-containing protein n=1 Tax=Amphimedon queenslandica TaxID=400682 RepID=A0A1X7UJN3_AMPQE
MTGICWTCKKNGTIILRNAGCEIERQSDVHFNTINNAIVAANEHIDHVRRDRHYCRKVLKRTKDAIKKLDLTIERPVNQVEVEVHYSFDYAQQVHYPNDPLQPGPIYFLIQRKCCLFGVCCEAFPRQVTYLVDEVMDTGKGANTVVSYVHHYIENHGVNGSMIHLNADKCTGQKKNNSLIQYLAWRVLTHRNKSFKISFLPVGHTKFSTDWCVGLIKQLFRKTAVGSLEDIAKRY